MVKGDKSQNSKTFKTMIAQYAKFNDGSRSSLIAVTAIATTWSILWHVKVAAAKAKSTTGPKMAKAIGEIKSSKSVPYFIGPKLLYTPKYHGYRTQPNEFKYIKAGTQADGVITPG